MPAKPYLILRITGALLVLVALLWLTSGMSRAEEDSSHLFQSYPTSTLSNEPYPTSTTGPYPGGTSTARPSATFSIPTLTPRASRTSPGTILPPTSAPPLNPTEILTGTQVLTNTATLIPVPSLELLFPRLGTATLTATASLSDRAREEQARIQAEKSPFRVNIYAVLVVVVWILLGIFLVVYLRRLGY